MDNFQLKLLIKETPDIPFKKKIFWEEMAKTRIFNFLERLIDG